MCYPQNSLFQTHIACPLSYRDWPVIESGLLQQVLYGRRAEEGGIQGKFKRRCNIGGRNS